MRPRKRMACLCSQRRFYPPFRYPRCPPSSHRQRLALLRGNHHRSHHLLMQGEQGRMPLIIGMLRPSSWNMMRAIVSLIMLPNTTKRIPVLECHTPVLSLNETAFLPEVGLTKPLDLGKSSSSAPPAFEAKLMAGLDFRAGSWDLYHQEWACK